MGKKKHKKYLAQKKAQVVVGTSALDAKSAPNLNATGMSTLGARTIVSHNLISPSKSQSEDPKSHNIMKYKWWYIGFSAVLLIPCIISLAIFGLKTSIDFTGGSVLKFSRTEGSWDQVQVHQMFVDKKIEVAQILLDDGGRALTVRTKPIDSARNEEIKLAFGNAITQTSFETVGSSIGAETAKRSLIAFGVACLGIVLYIAYAFRNIPRPYSSLRFGLSAILAMVHDAIIVTGVFSLLGHFEGVEVDPMFLTALLTIIGFSVHDTIVVFDRVRENLGKFKGKNIDWIANFSILETMRRSIATSATVVITLTSLLIFGGPTIKHFILALLIGVISGTYSSIFNATPVLVIWEDFLSRQKKQ